LESGTEPTEGGELCYVDRIDNSTAEFTSCESVGGCARYVLDGDTLDEVDGLESAPLTVHSNETWRTETWLDGGIHIISTTDLTLSDGTLFADADAAFTSEQWVVVGVAAGFSTELVLIWGPTDDLQEVRLPVANDEGPVTPLGVSVTAVDGRALVVFQGRSEASSGVDVVGWTVFDL